MKEATHTPRLSKRHSDAAKAGTDRSSAYSKQAAQALHGAICLQLGVDHVQGLELPVRSEIARKLGVRAQRYAEAVKGSRGSLPSVCLWITRWNNEEERETAGLSNLQLTWDGTQFGVTPLED